MSLDSLYHPLWAFLGTACILVTLYDSLRSTLSSIGWGPLATRWGRRLWRLSLRLDRHFEGARHVAPPVILIGTVMLWMGTCWLGWTLIFSSSATAVVDPQTLVPLGLTDRIYFAGLSLATLGAGDVVAGSPMWRVLSALAAFNGFFLLTLAVAYFVPLIDASVVKRVLAFELSSLGVHVEETLCNGWDGERFEPLERVLDGLVGRVVAHTERMRTSPVVHYFSGAKRATALSPSLLVLDDTLSVIAALDDSACHFTPVLLRRARRAIEQYASRAQMLEGPGENAPPSPALDLARQHGVPLPAPEALERELDQRAEVRTVLATLSEHGGWPVGRAPAQD